MTKQAAGHIERAIAAMIFVVLRAAKAARLRRLAVNGHEMSESASDISNKTASRYLDTLEGTFMAYREVKPPPVGPPQMWWSVGRFHTAACLATALWQPALNAGAAETD